MVEGPVEAMVTVGVSAADMLAVWQALDRVGVNRGQNDDHPKFQRRQTARLHMQTPGTGIEGIVTTLTTWLGQIGGCLPRSMITARRHEQDDRTDSEHSIPKK